MTELWCCFGFATGGLEDCRAGKTCPVKGAVDSMFKQRYRDQMIDLIQMVIEHACDPNHDCTGDTKRVTNLKN